MKKVLSLLMVLVALMMATPSQAQLIKFGVKGGMNFAEFDTDVKSWNEVLDRSTGYFIGPMAEVTLPIVGLGLDGALLYSQRGKGEAKQQGIEIPVNLKWTIGLGSLFGIYLAAGPDFYYNFEKDDYYALLKTKKSQVAVNLGAGIKLLKKLQVGVNYQMPLSDSYYYVDKVVDGNQEGGVRTKCWQVSLAYIF